MKELLEKMQEKSQEVAILLKALSHPKRLLLLCHLTQGEKSVSKLLEYMDISQPQLSSFLGRLQREDILKVRKEGNFSYYSIKSQEVLELIKFIEKTFCE